MGKACRLLGLTVLYSVLTVIAHGFIAPRPTSSAPIATRVMATSSPFTSLPEGISSYSTSRLGDDVQQEIRAVARKALLAARADNVPLMEIEFPPLLGGRLAKRSTDDYTNIEVLDANRDWAMEFVSAAALQELETSLWVVFADDTELELAKEAYPGKKFQAGTLTTLNAAAAQLGGPKADVAAGLFSTDWLKKELQKVTGGKQDDATDGVATNSAPSSPSSDENAVAAGAAPELVLAVQPGDGGPLEDWLNVELLQQPGNQVLVLNGQLDKVRDGYYNRFIFPKIGAVADRFYQYFEPIYYLKPLRDKGFTGWLYRVYPEPWQVIIQQKEDGEGGTRVAELEKRPSYREAIDLMKRAGMSRLGHE